MASLQNLYGGHFRNLGVMIDGLSSPWSLWSLGHSTPPVLSICPLYTNSGFGKERRILIGSSC